MCVGSRRRDSLTCSLTYAHPDDPEHDPSVRGDPYKTLFVSRLSYEVKENDLEREFGRFGPIERVRSLFPPAFPRGNDHCTDATGRRYVLYATKRRASTGVMRSLYTNVRRT